jgi:hypothetical protein
LEPEKVRALSDFYREEFQRQLDQLHASGAVDETAAMEKMCRRFLADLDDLCWRADFKAVAETLLKSFDTLTGLSRLDPRKGH